MDYSYNRSSADRPAAPGSMFLLTIGWITAVLSLIRYPYFFGVIAVIMGIMASKQGSRSGLRLILASILFIAAGLIFNEIFYSCLKKVIGI
ncbi:MAG TPA: hypothetical protein VHT96_04170 [Clostridia bacterium]|nr:hypothetical protein [Clostridia bacterium]